MEKVNSLSIIVPVYNSQVTLRELVTRLSTILPDITNEFEILLVNDGSRDDSWEIVKSLSEQYTFVHGVNLMRNYGQHNALLCGIRLAAGEICVTMDDDLQHPPEEIPLLLAPLQDGFDVVYGFPRKLPHSPIRNFFSRLTKKTLAAVMGIKTVREISAFRAFRTDLRKAFEFYRSPGVIIDALLSWGTTKFTSVLVEEVPRQHGQSNYNFSQLISQAIFVLTGFSTFPLHFASWMGFILTLFGLAIFIFVVASYFTAGSIPGFPFLASIISIFSGTQLFALGIFGEYLARIFDRSMGHPAYVIGETTSSNPSGEKLS
jgi:undecaprenyl-phosphate 4-deoxy-4-formamido-L-arabinose transferase